ncbi:MAG: CCA tRNA nucleotidyltransferase, partial [Aestuariivirgaceae bacterium]
MSSLPSLAGESWLNTKALQSLLAVLSAEGGEARIAGGAVRNALLGEPIADIDIATTLLPEEVMTRARDAGMGVHETGIAHGTVTVVVHDQAQTHVYEVTTLRVDEETDGRRATVAFTDDWQADAARRDFTINALYC